ncbi:MAG: ankyrin repeat domain-containing protein [Leptospiraceae bacterium]|nr:ankyrin repeat domain-containing protein [Leptospiraceae bacterium]
MKLLSFFEAWNSKNTIRNLIKSIHVQDKAKFEELLTKAKDAGLLNDSAFILLFLAGTEIEDLFFLDSLLKVPMDPNVSDEAGVPLIHFYVEMGRIESLERILKYGANPNARDKGGVTPLHVANSYDGLGDISDLLLSFGADPNLRDNIGKRYLM